jgi:serine/threonine-protein kinase
MGLTQKILLFTSLILVLLTGTTLLFTTLQADSLAHQTIEAGLKQTRGLWQSLQADRYDKLMLGVRTLANDPGFKALIANREEDPQVHEQTMVDTLNERRHDVMAGLLVATDPGGAVIGRSDRQGAYGEELGGDPLLAGPLERKNANAVWRQGDALYYAVAVPITIQADVLGVLVAGYAIDKTLAGEVRGLTDSEIAFLLHDPGQPPKVIVTTLGTKEAVFRDALSRPELASGTAGSDKPFELDLDGERYAGVQIPLAAADQKAVGSVVALRSLTAELKAFGEFRMSLIYTSLGVMAVALVVAYLVASRITGPVRRLVSVVEKARDGSYTGPVEVSSSDEIGVLGRSFNRLLAELREKEQMIGFLRQGTADTRKPAATTAALGATMGGSQETAAIQPAGQTMPRFDRGSIFAGRYEILEVLGKGGMGVVYRARDRKLDEVVALKVVRAEALSLDPTLLDRFKQEIKLARRITHRNVLRTHEFNEADGVPYISMEYLEGVTLKELIKSRGALPVGIGLRIAKQMCQGLEAAHQQGVVHRDIKPQNMLILPETGDLKIMDFGIARVSEVKGAPESGLTSTGAVMGTPDYLSPEQAQGRPADFRSDLYSLGVVLFEVFTGALPFTGDTVMAVILKHVQSPPPRPRQINPRVPEPIETVVLRCLDKRPEARPAGVGELLKELTEISARHDAGAA